MPDHDDSAIDLGSDFEQDTEEGSDQTSKDPGHQPGSEGNALVPSPSKTHELSRFSEMHLSANTTDQETAGEEATEAAANSTPRTESATSKADAAAVNTDLEQTQYTQADLLELAKTHDFARNWKDIYMPLFNVIKEHYNAFPGPPLNELLWKNVPKEERPPAALALVYILGELLPRQGKPSENDGDGCIYNFTSRTFWSGLPEQEFAKIPERRIEPVKIGLTERRNNTGKADSKARLQAQEALWRKCEDHFTVPTEYRNLAEMLIHRLLSIREYLTVEL
eukprot:scpid92247/ scgid2063/ 